VSLSTCIIGRTSCETVKDPVTSKAVVKSGQIIDEETAAALEKVGLEQLKIRSALTCESKRGICAKCWTEPGDGPWRQAREAVGIIAAQSIGEPGTQLTMRTFHVGGTASQTFKQPIIRAKNEVLCTSTTWKVVESTESNFVVLNKNGTVSVHVKDGRELESYNIVIGSVISIADGTVKKAKPLSNGILQRADHHGKGWQD
jgi:DNA-directed RNA polymerase subunit beta'